MIQMDKIWKKIFAKQCCLDLAIDMLDDRTKSIEHLSGCALRNFQKIVWFQSRITESGSTIMRLPFIQNIRPVIQARDLGWI